MVAPQQPLKRRPVPRPDRCDEGRIAIEIEIDIGEPNHRRWRPFGL